jgi:hypothetical protein
MHDIYSYWNKSRINTFVFKVWGAIFQRWSRNVKVPIFAWVEHMKKQSITWVLTNEYSPLGIIMKLNSPPGIIN